MASSDPRNVGLSKNCMEALVAYSDVSVDVQDDIHSCFMHKHERSCKHLEEFGHKSKSEARENVSKWCFIRPQRNRSEGK